MARNRSQQGKRNRVRGAALQREVVQLFKKHGLEAFNRDRGGAQHEGGDIQYMLGFYGCKRKKKIAQYLYPEKQETGVFIREDRGPLMVVLHANHFVQLLGYADKVAQLFVEQEKARAWRRELDEDTP